MLVKKVTSTCKQEVDRADYFIESIRENRRRGRALRKNFLPKQLSIV